MARFGGTDVVVDSFSNDGTVDYLREHLRHLRVNFVSHPPGLYASWNHGIAQVTAPLTYIATVGDTITRAGIETLVQAANALACDVVVSKPDFVAPEGSALPDIPWPVDDIIATLGIAAPRRLHKLEALVFAAVHVNGALTGSCASCVYRTATLRQFPFPPEFGTVGDGAWGVMHAAEIAWGVVPGRCSIFLKHPPSVSDVDKRSYAQSRRMDEVLAATVLRWLASGAVTQRELETIGWLDLFQAVTRHTETKVAFDRRRSAAWPWWLNSAAWGERIRRQRARTRLAGVKAAALRRIADACESRTKPGFPA